MAKSKQPDHILTIKTEKAFEFELTDKQKADKGMEAAKLRQELKGLESDFSEIKKGWKARIDGKRDLLYKRLDEISRGKERREVKCTKTIDFKIGQVTFDHEGVVMEEREIEPWEEDQNQKKLFKEGKKGDTQMKNKGVKVSVNLPTEKQKEIEEVRKSETNIKTKKSPIDASESAKVTPISKAKGKNSDKK